MTSWLVKTEPEVFSIDDLARERVTAWTGVRNYQARNSLMAMEVDDRVLIYHSNAQPSGIVGLSRVVAKAIPDVTQFDQKSEYFDPKASTSNPRWFCPSLEFVRKFGRLIALDELRGVRALEGLELLRKGSRLSVIPVSDQHFKAILGLI